MRGFADGFVTVLLADYLSRLGFSALQVGALITGTLVGSAALTFCVGWFAAHWDYRRVLLGASALMVATGLGFAGLHSFWPLFLVGFVGTMSPSAGDVSLFLPLDAAERCSPGIAGARPLQALEAGRFPRAGQGTPAPRFGQHPAQRPSATVTTSVTEGR